MLQPLIIVDNFLKDPASVVREISAIEFQDLQGPDGATYKRVAPLANDRFAEEISAAVGFPVKQSYTLARLNLKGEAPNNLVHSDGSYDEFAMVLYLTAPEHCFGGTAFWRHRLYRWDALPNEVQLRRLGRNPRAVTNQLQKDWDREDAWELVKMAQMSFNRAIFYPTAAFHSRYPFKAFGNDVKDGRLVVVSFFNRA